MNDRRPGDHTPNLTELDEDATATDQAARPAPGKVTRTMRLASDRHARTVQLRQAGGGARGREHVAPDADDAHAIAERGVGGASGRLPFADVIAGAFGRHDISGVRVAIGGAAAEAATALGARAFATGDAIAFADQPDLHLAAHEAAHVIQQRAGVALAGGIGQAGDAYERHADAVADAVVRGESAEALLDHGPGGGGGGVQRAIQRDERDRTERAQSWDPTITGRLDDGHAGASSSEVAAIRANIDLGLTDDKLQRLRGAFGLRARGRGGAAIDRDLVRAIRAHQGDRGTGVLDEATVFAIDLGRAWPNLAGAAPWYRRTPPWAALDAAQLALIRTEVDRALRVGDADLTLSAGTSGHAVVSERFVQQAVNWQFWNHARDATVSWGRLTGDDLTNRLHVAIAVAPADAAAAGDATAAPEPDASAADIAADAADTAGGSELGVEDDDDGGGLAPTERAELLALRTTLSRYTRAAAAAAATAEIDRIHRRAMELGVYNEWIRAAESARPHMKARWTIDGISAALGETVRPLPGRPARPAAAGATPDGTVPELVRHDAREAIAHLDESRVAVDRASDGSIERRELVRGEHGWEGRVLPGGHAGGSSSSEAVTTAARDIIPGLQRVKRELEDWAQRLHEVDATPARIPAVLAALQRALPLQVPRTLRRPWHPALPRDLTESQWSTPSRARETARLWGRSLRTAAADCQRQITLHERYQRGSLRRTRDAVRVDFSRTGVRVTNNHGRQLGADEMHLEVVFADAMLRFLEMVRGLGATEMWTAGFLREPISPDDTHPRGQACDITGFKFGDVMIHLRNGRRDPAGYPAGGERTCSDWYNHADKINGQSYSQILHALTARMATYFSRIVGPGHDAAHAGHWHVELTDGTPRTPRIHAIQDAPPEAAAESEAAETDGEAEPSPA
ncbi:MAG TPA: DUF4157 domain-containing protein [Kofleriaceae bacterium]|nr:DUF4157 domain-containing protein [Kofleriaceae bacterium]